jgi:hypothetical protein
MSATRSTLLALKGYKIRTETYQGQEHLVVPVVALVEGVVHAMNALDAEFVPSEEFLRAPAGWNGRPVFLGHPMRDGRPVLGNTPEVLEAEQIGIVFNSKGKDSKLTMEAWVNVERAEKLAPKLLQRIKDGDPVEISVGVQVSTDDSEGTYLGKTYKGKWTGLMPDHLALLPETDEGACSVSMGCGVRAASKPKGVAVKTESGFVARVLAAMPGLRSLMNTEDMTDNDLRNRLATAVRLKYPNCSYVDSWYPVQNPTNVVFNCSHYAPPTPGPSYEAYPVYTFKLYDMAFTLDSNGAVTLNGEPTEVEAVTRYEPVSAAGVVEPRVAAAGKPCSCQHPQPTIEEKAMQKAERVTALIGKSKVFTEADRAMLEASSDDQMARFEAHSAAPETPAAPATPAPAAQAAPAAAPAAPAAPAAADVKEPTLEDLLAKAPADVRDSFAEIRTAAATKKASTIKALKDTGRCQMTDEQLNAKSQADLDQLVALAGSNVRAAIDYSGQGQPRQPETSNEAPPAPKDLGAEIRAARGQK